ncbi:MAG: c-type cytochrome domain-containing protein [Gemmataceae bacterium]
MRSCRVTLVVGLFLGAAAVRAEEPILAEQAYGVLKRYCHQCHGQGGSAKGGMNFILDRETLIRREVLLPGKPEQSKLFQEVAQAHMPPAGASARPGAADIAILNQWIAAGAPAFRAAPPRSFLSDSLILERIAADLRAIDPRQRRFMRYLTLHHLYNAQQPDSELHATRQALAQLLNSLSWHPRLTVPAAVDDEQTILRLDLRAYQWNARLWDRIVALYPYRRDLGPWRDIFKAESGAELPVLRGDWFVATAARPPLYHDLLRLPSTDRELERQLRVEVLTNSDEGTAWRAGFNGSGVSKNNRLIERHDAAHGAYWRSYDFADNLARHNLFEHPLGPAPGQNSFEHAGGEIIFHLPNGLLGFMLVDALGRRIDKAPVEIVTDPQRPDKVIVNGLSCFSCHGQGYIFKEDQVWPHVAQNRAAFSAEHVDVIKSLYVPPLRLKTLLDEDNERYHEALRRLDILLTEKDALTAVTLRYEAELDIVMAAGETGLAPLELQKQLPTSPDIRRVFGPLANARGTVQRDLWETEFSRLVRELKLDDQLTSTSAAAPVAADAALPFAGHTAPVTCVSFSPNGQWVLTGSADQTLRLWQVPTGGAARRFVGHADAITALAWSGDGRRIISGSADRTVRVWDVSSGQLLRTFTGHTDAVHGVALSADGRWAASGGRDRTIRLWDVARGKEARVLTGHTRQVNSIAFSQDGQKVLSGSHDGTVRLWEFQSGKELLRLAGHGREVYAVTLAADGKFALSGGNDKTARLWDLTTGQEIRRFTGHDNAIIAVAINGSGQQILTGSSQYGTPDQVLRRWDCDTGKQIQAIAPSPSARVAAVAFSPDGRYALTANADNGTLRWWELPE